MDLATDGSMRNTNVSLFISSTSSGTESAPRYYPGGAELYSFWRIHSDILVDPSKVLQTLNESFLMEDQNNLYFTAWYGVIDVSTHELIHANAGHPNPLILIPNDEDAIGASADTRRKYRLPIALNC